MWALALTIFAGCKWLTWWKAPSRAGSSYARSLGYLLAWVGMDAKAFLRPAPTVCHPGLLEWLFAGFKACVGAVLIWEGARMVPASAAVLRGWIGLAGCVFLFHFGAFHLLSLAWRTGGVDAQPIMRAPILAMSLTEFWGARWNVAFHQLAHEMAFRPLRRTLGYPLAILAVFGLSGVIHEAVISVPANGGYGLPTAYFLLQGLGVLWERSGFARRLGFGQGWRGRLFTLSITAGPVAFLFHPPFIHKVILPFLETIGAF